MGRRPNESFGDVAPLGSRKPCICEQLVMESIAVVRVFTRVVEYRSFTKAADSLSLPKSSVTKKVKKLEAQLGVQLLVRTTRSIVLTEGGLDFYRRARLILKKLDRIEGEIDLWLRTVRADKSAALAAKDITIDVAMNRKTPMRDQRIAFTEVEGRASEPS